jgi:hypothetical protein
MFEHWFSMFVTIFTSILASSGFWAYIQKKKDAKDNKIQMLVGLGHDRIMELGGEYIERGWITRDEYENMHDYLYAPYKEMGGNGSAERMMREVDKLPIRNNQYNKKEVE